MTAELDNMVQDMARQTAQAKLLREARDYLAKRAERLAEARDRKGLERLGLPPANTQRLIEGGTFNTEDMAAMLGVSLPTLRSWLQPGHSQVHREMPKTAKLLLDRILEE